MKYIFTLVAVLFGVNVCLAQTPADTVTLDTLSVTAPAGPQAYRASAPREWEIKHTRIALSFNKREKTADVREWIKLRPYFYETDTLELDAKSVRIDSVWVLDKNEHTRLNYTYENDKLKIHFWQVYRMTDSVELFLKYTAMPYAAATGGSASITDDRGLYFVNTDYAVPHKPSMIWTQGETESNSHWMITIDKPNSRFTTQIELTVPDSFTTLSNGALVKQVKGNFGMRTDIWKEDMPIQAYSAMFAIGKFSIVKQNWKNKEMSYYVEPEYESVARLMFAHTPEMTEFFSQRTGVPYPWNKYSQVVVRDYISGAMENTTATLFGEFMNQNAREIADKNHEDVVSHELFHQWFGDYVTAESWSNITVNESFANYGEQLWRAFRYGRASADELAYNDLQTYITAAQYNGDPQLVRFYYDSREDVFDPISYNKGGAILRYLNKLTGDAAFDKAMNLYLTRNALHSAEAHSWRLAVEEATGQDWNWFFNQWYYHAGHPVLKVVYNYDDAGQKLKVAVSQVQADSPFVYRLPLKAAVHYGDARTVVDWNISKRTDTFTYAYRNGRRPLVIPDVDHVLPGEIKDGKSLAEWLAQFKERDDYVSKRLAVAAAGKLLSDSSSLVIIDLALSDELPSVRRHALEQLKATQNDRYQRKFSKYVSYMAVTDSNKQVRAEAFDVLGQWKVTSAKPSMVQALTYSSYLITGAALQAINRIDNDTAYVLAKQMLSTEPRSLLETEIWTIIGKKGADEDIALFEEHAPYVFNNKKFSFTSSLEKYMKNVKSNSSFSRGANVYFTLVATEGIKSYRSYMGDNFFKLAKEQKDNLKSEDKDELGRAEVRMNTLKPLFQKFVAAEKDPEIVKDYQKKMKEIFE